jgi:hypothetical protein
VSGPKRTWYYQIVYIHESKTASLLKLSRSMHKNIEKKFNQQYATFLISGHLWMTLITYPRNNEQHCSCYHPDGENKRDCMQMPSSGQDHTCNFGAWLWGQNLAYRHGFVFLLSNLSDGWTGISCINTLSPALSMEFDSMAKHRKQSNSTASKLHQSVPE